MGELLIGIVAFILAVNVAMGVRAVLIEWRWRRAQNHARARLHDTRWIGKGW